MLIYAVLVDDNGVVTNMIHSKEMDESFYTENGFIIVNAEYPSIENRFGKDALLKLVDGKIVVDYVSRPLSPEEEVKQLKDKLDLIQQAMDDMILGGML